ncbi:MAG: 3-isopropylmalate dehydrogenase [Varibaculum sp.]|nr:3-isopropylmalate dehydrogenase [Varibaculum sp.]
MKIALVPGDGIGTEVVAEAVKVLKQVHGETGLELNEFDFGARRYHRTGEVLTDADLDQLAQHDAIMLGAIGDPSVTSGILERGFLLKMRFAFDQYVNLRPAIYYPGTDSPLKHPEGTDFVVVREGTEGLYVGNGGTVRGGTEAEIATEVSINTAHGVQRVVDYAFELAMKRDRHLTYVHKHNVLVFAGSLWRRIVEASAEKYPEVNLDYLHVDAATIKLVTDPQFFDVIVTDNLFGDIITDEAGAITGGIGLAASACINPEKVFPSMFEPVHGSAPDIAGTGRADPVATILSLALLLDHMDLGAEAARVRAAVQADMEARAADTALAGRSTCEIGDAIAARV